MVREPKPKGRGDTVGCCLSKRRKMSKRRLKDKLIKRDDIKEELRLIPNSNAYCTPSGKFYADYGNDMFYPLKPIINPHNKYVYVGIRYSHKQHNTSKRAHRLVAQCYIPNPNNYKVVGHKNNIKSDNRVENLYWTTVQENTQKAFDDGLAKNDKGWDDSQSIPVDVYDRKNRLIDRCGSISEASAKYKVTKQGIIHQCKNKPKKVRKKYIFRYLNDVL